MRSHAILLVVGLALAACTGPAPAQVRPGITVLLADSAHLIKGKRLGLLSNQTGSDSAGRRDVDLLTAAGYKLTALFSPEHGFRGAEDRPGLPDTRDSASGLPIYSLYGGKRAAREAALDSVDVLLVDLQDIGARYYTYPASATQLLREAARRKLRLIVLDRPDPIGGQVQGNLLDPAFRSFVGALAMPMRPGMSLGELARLADLDLAIGANPRVVPAAGWRREQTLWDLGLPFLPPSPNLKDLESLFHYPGTCLFEGTALSVGRGTNASFRQIGAPWLDPARVIAALPLSRLPGVQFRAVRFTPIAPGDGKYPGTAVEGIRLVLTYEKSYDPTLTAVALLTAIHQVHPDSLGFRAAGFDRLAGGPALREAVLAGMDPFAIVATWRAPLEEWLRHRQPALLYK